MHFLSLIFWKTMKLKRCDSCAQTNQCSDCACLEANLSALRRCVGRCPKAFEK